MVPLQIQHKAGVDRQENDVLHDESYQSRYRAFACNKWFKLGAPWLTGNALRTIADILTSGDLFPYYSLCPPCALLSTPDSHAQLVYLCSKSKQLAHMLSCMYYKQPMYGTQPERPDHAMP